jgi:hypothetical protein
MRHPAIQLKDLWRILRVFQFLIVRPMDLLPYIRFSLFSHRTPLDLGVPWWSFGAVRALKTILHQEMDAFEFGSGGSSLYVGSRVRSLTCVEDELEWHELVHAAAQDKGLKAFSVLHKPFDFWNTSDFEQSDYFQALDKKYDLIIVDGKEYSDQIRDSCFWKAEKHIAKNGFIILDDSWRYPQVKEKNHAKKWTEYTGTGYCRRGVTSTCIFEY